MERELSERAKQVLKLVIEEYVVTARPVGSGTLQERYNLPYSSATLRNEMAELERRGLLTHLHTSGGRVPSEDGYRLFVEHLMDRLGLSPVDIRRVEHQFHQVEYNPVLERWVELAASVLAQLARNAALVTTPTAHDVLLKQIHLVHLTERQAFMVAVMDDGMVRQSVITLPHSAEQEELNSVAAALNAVFAGADAAELRRRAERLQGLAADVAPQALNLLGENRPIGDVISSGLINMLSQPEFQRPESARPIVAALEDGTLMAQIVNRLSDGPGAQVIIGSENPLEEMSNCSVVTTTYRTGRGGQGVLMVVGPTRMRYERTISSVLYLSQLLSRMLDTGN